MLAKQQSFIWITFHREGVHCYPAAAVEESLATKDWRDVSFLAHPHRHIFHFRIEIEVFDDDRDIEFIQLKRFVERSYDQGTLQLNNKSCEMIARDVHNLLSKAYPDRDMIIEVSEDGENGCRMYFPK